MMSSATTVNERARDDQDREHGHDNEQDAS